MKTLTRFFVLLLFLSIFTGCPDEKPPIIPPPPPTNCEYPAGNRNFTWRLDTVAWWPSTLGGVHAFSDSDVWVMGNMFGPTVANQISYSAVHWDGNSWNEKVDFLTVLMNANDVTGDDKIMVGVGYRLILGEKAAIAEYNKQTKQWTTYQFETLGDLRSVWTDGKGYFIAVGDSGMVYTKNGYTAGWVYSKAPTEFGFFDVIGISKNETYMAAAQALITGEFYLQGWKFQLGTWVKLYDTKDTSNTPIQLLSSDYPNRIGVSRCSITDSLKLFVIGDQSYLFESKGQELVFRKTNLSSLGLPLKANGRSGISINLFSPNDYWIFGTRYNFYNWNGTNFQKIDIPGLPNDDMHFGIQLRMIKTISQRIFLPTEVSSQVYVVVQGTP